MAATPQFPYYNMRNKLDRATVFYSYMIGVKQGSGVTSYIGMCEQLSQRSQRTVERIREIWPQGPGPIPVDMVWGGSDVSLELHKVELYEQSLMSVFGSSASLDWANALLTIQEILYLPNSDSLTNSTSTRVITFNECVVANHSKQIQTGQARIVENVTIEVSTVSVSDNSVISSATQVTGGTF